MLQLTFPHPIDTQIWSAQPRVWEGMVLLPKYVGAREVTDKMAEALLALPAPQLQVRVFLCGLWRLELVGVCVCVRGGVVYVFMKLSLVVSAGW
jgi:hypothetical protein